MMARRLWVLSTTRADYGLLYWLLREIDEDPELELMLAVSGSHLSPEFGYTVGEIERDGFRIHRRLEVLLSADSRTAMTKAMGLAMLACGDALGEDRPDMVVLLGDRFEIVPAALAAVTHGIPLVHLHGGETSRGALDEYFRHAVTKLANIHFPAAERYRRRILQMGEDPERVFNFGAPGLDHLHRSEPIGREALAEVLGLSLDRPTAIVTYHPATSEPDRGERSPVAALLEALEGHDALQVVFSKANADTRGRAINAHLARWCDAHPERSRLFDNLGPRIFHGCLRHLDVMIGNSSSGLVEAPSFRLPVVNVGSRQEGRLAAANVIAVDNEASAIRDGIARALDPAFRARLADLSNPYDRFGDGLTSRRIKDTLKAVPLGAGLVKKGFIDIRMAAGTD
ncbi:UDP-N-acetylglucosamine 2-epimerase [Halomonas organivorans]|uniref:UDP-N-acetylglucosamine 2-epimerase (Non-hydrolyzing)/GDP/UDP-N,N'-diacetylbacillosamine 2-epimerase (Hydrolyzing) n=1 Tax=Halomonas organivorans TaxID=257772 RepID=A0A7W5BVT0_9GAMM|nr:UDP-N-acetylglucosamine 2-epimerase [Halomonas organivorans]MBB3140067.1 UDP-N-acetylglucosamine 2-epimerase (non-hydrolyzing)/GDP/UDP-N,N'-diacetylbacillosamine 2-epimerase (hydrolyzing) [Halomonas organivorans]